MTDTDAGKMLSEKELAEIIIRAEHDAALSGRRDLTSHGEFCTKDRAALLSHITALTANRGSVSEERADFLLTDQINRDKKASVKIGRDIFVPEKSAIAAIQQAGSECFGGGAEEIINAVKLRLREHWITGVHCDHERKTDRASCSCATWRGEEKPSIDAAVQDWVEHAMQTFPRGSAPDFAAIHKLDNLLLRYWEDEDFDECDPETMEDFDTPEKMLAYVTKELRRIAALPLPPSPVKSWCQHCGKEAPIECWDCAQSLNLVIPQVIIDGLKSTKKIALAFVPGKITWADWEAAWKRHDAAMEYLEKLNSKAAPSPVKESRDAVCGLDKCPVCCLNWLLNSPVKVAGSPLVRCTQCKNQFPHDAAPHQGGEGK